MITKDKIRPFVPRTLSGKPVVRSGPDEIERRVEKVESWLRQGIFLRSALKKKIKELWNIEWRMADIYIAKARQRLLVHLNQSKELHRAESLGFYQSVIADKKATAAEKTRARERIDKLLGLEQPTEIKHEISTRQRGVNIDSLPLKERKKILKALRDTPAIDIPAQTA